MLLQPAVLPSPHVHGTRAQIKVSSLLTQVFRDLAPMSRLCPPPRAASFSSTDQILLKASSMSSFSCTFWDSPHQMISYLPPQPHSLPQALCFHYRFYWVPLLGLPFLIYPHAWSLPRLVGFVLKSPRPQCSPWALAQGDVQGMLLV